MARDNNREPNPQEAQRDGQSAISQDSPLRELNQEGDPPGGPPTGATPGIPELTDEEISVLCDIGRDGFAKPHKQLVIKSLTQRGFVISFGEPPAPSKLTSRAQELLSQRGVGLNES